MNADRPKANTLVAATLIPIALAARSLDRTARQCDPVGLRRTLTTTTARIVNVTRATSPKASAGSPPRRRAADPQVEPEQRRCRNVDAGEAAGDLLVAEHERIDRDPGAEGDDRQVDAPHPECGQRDDEPDRDRHQPGVEQPEHERHFGGASSLASMKPPTPANAA